MSHPLDNTIRRRMTNTGESYDVAKAHVERITGVILRNTVDQGEWVDAWIAPAPWSPTVEQLVELRQLAETSRALMLQWPPLCVVRAKVGRTFLVPFTSGDERRPGLVIGYAREAGAAHDNRLLVTAGPTGNTRVALDPADLELVGCKAGLTRERLAEVLS